jgi:hypothetical protein
MQRQGNEKAERTAQGVAAIRQRVDNNLGLNAR